MNKDIIEFKDYSIRYTNLEAQDWITLYNNENNENNEYNDDIFEYSALIENDSEYISEYLEEETWGFNTNSFGSSCFGKNFNDNQIYFLDGLVEGKFEYLVACRHFNEKYESVIEINPKLIWYYNLVKVENQYIDPLTDEVKIKIENGKILVLKTYLKDFLSAYKKKCIICFDNRRFFKTESKVEYHSINTKNERMNFVIDINSYRYNEYNGLSRILGKVIIEAYQNPRHKDYKIYSEEKKYEDFIIGEESSTGEEIEYTCNEDKLANYFGKNLDAPHFLTPVFFNKKVLDKYIGDPSNYTIGDGNLFYLDEWYIPFTINKDEKVMVWLGDLGRLPYKEQKYWKIYNEIPLGGIEEKFFKRQIEGEFTDAITPEKKLFELIGELNGKFKTKYGDVIINNLSEADKQIKSAFMIPSNGSITVYQTFLMQLCKITAENINKNFIQNNIENDKLCDENGNKYGSIKQLLVFMEEEGYKNATKLNDILKLIYASRNALAGHKGSLKKYNKVWKRDENYKPNFISDAKKLLLSINSCLNDFIEEI